MEIIREITNEGVHQLAQGYYSLIKVLEFKSELETHNCKKHNLQLGKTNEYHIIAKTTFCHLQN